MQLIFCLGGNRAYMAMARAFGWRIGARLPAALYPDHYPLAFADQDWRKFDGLSPDDPAYQIAYTRYVAAVAAAKPTMASVIDWEHTRPLSDVLTWAHAISRHVETVMIIPKVPGAVDRIPQTIDGVPVTLGFSVPTPHGATECLPDEFSGRRTHLLGGSVLDQIRWAPVLLAAGADVVSADGNSFHYAAGRGTYFDGRRFVNHGPRAISTIEAMRRSLENIPRAWHNAGWTLEPIGQFIDRAPLVVGV